MTSRIQVLLLLIAAAPVLAQVETPPEAEAERLWAEATRLIQLDQLPEALSALDDMVELEALHPGLELPPLFWAVHAAAAEEEGLHDVAVSSALRYVDQRNSNAAEHYGFALRLVVDADLEALRLADPDREIHTLNVDGKPVEGMEPPARKNPHSYPPRKTAWAREAGAYGGAAVIGFVIDERGRVEDPVALQDPGYGLGLEAARAVKRYKFKPATLHGEPVAVYRIVTINFPP
ncbi:MAG: energy transducer TonB [Holophagales bacterium]|nr:energy transducer TonB [Holophagales bacterium]MYC11413.1 energy transducer TonB [Holophagales bacterium]